MATDGNGIKQISSNNYFCKNCHYDTKRKSNYDNHLLTTKHKMATDFNKKQQKTSNNFECDKCNKIYKDRTGLWKHKKNCNTECEDEIVNRKDFKPKTCDKDLIIMLIKQNSELIKECSEFKNIVIDQKNIFLEVVKQGTTNNYNNTNTTHTNSHNKAFNLQFFLNETCKDAMNIGEFVDSLKIQLLDLENIGEVGYIEGISNIIVKNLKALDITKRPVHCTDKKRETVYIKDSDKWEKDEGKAQMHKLVKKIVSNNVKMFAKFREAHPDCTTYHSKFSDQYNKIIYESMGGKGDDDIIKNEKIIKNVLREVFVDK